MRRTNNIINIINLMLFAILMGSFVSVINMDVNVYTSYVKNEQLLTYLNSNHLEKNISCENQASFEETVESDKTTVEDENTKNISKNTEVDNIKKEETTTKQVVEKTKENDTTKEVVDDKKIEVSKSETVIEKLTGSLAGYGPDCVGCTSFRTASGRYIGDGKIYYEDKEYGKIRIVAGDKSYPFGTIVKISNTNYGDNSPIYAVVLDRGGGVGKGKKFLFDLLFTTEKEAAKAGSRKNVTFEILRLGY